MSRLFGSPQVQGFNPAGGSFSQQLAPLDAIVGGQQPQPSARGPQILNTAGFNPLTIAGGSLGGPRSQDVLRQLRGQPGAAPADTYSSRNL